MAQNNFILFQRKKSAENMNANQIYLVKSNDIPEITRVMATGAVEVGRLQTSLSKEEFVKGMNALEAYMNGKYSNALHEILQALNEIGMT